MKAYGFGAHLQEESDIHNCGESVLGRGGGRLVVPKLRASLLNNSENQNILR